jgi:leucyl/phenylalanyl-tRNA--protein transferase
MPVFRLSEELIFPPPHLATEEGLLAVGGDLSEKRLLLAYRMGIFPWYSEDEPILWWSPDPRLVLYLREFRISRSLRKTIRRGLFQVTLDRSFRRVITECAQVRTENGERTWLVEDMIRAYCRLHGFGFAHSVETWQNGRLVGGLYGVSLGKCFFGESMFARVNDASKVALVALVQFLKQLSFPMVDCQVATSHLMSFGAREIPRDEYLRQLGQCLESPTLRGNWSLNVPAQRLDIR